MTDVTPARQRPYGPRGTGQGREHGRVRDAEAGGWAAGYAQGFRDGVEAQPDRELYAVVEVPWSSVRAEDTVIGDDGAHYHVVRSGRVPASGGACGPAGSSTGWIVTLVSGTYREVHCRDHDERVRVLMPVSHADALSVTRAALGGRLIATRADPGPVGSETTFDGDLPWRVGSAGG